MHLSAHLLGLDLNRFRLFLPRLFFGLLVSSAFCSKPMGGCEFAIWVVMEA